MISVDGSLIIQIINVLVLIWVLNIVLYRPIRNILMERRNRIDGYKEGIDLLHSKAESKDNAYKKGLLTARAEGQKEKNNYLGEAAAEETKIIGEINRKAQDEMAAMKQKVARDAAGVRETLMNEVDTFAEAISKKILGGTAS